MEKLKEGMQVTIWTSQDNPASIWQLQIEDGKLIPYADVVAYKIERQNQVAQIGIFLLSIGLATIILFSIKCISFLINHHYHKD